jgi:hemerythrin
MEKLNWTSRLSVGVDVFDEHHRRVILMINRLINAQQVTTDSEIISDLLSRMTAYAQEHLKAEEKLMAEYGYPQLEQHKAEHRAYTRKTVDFCTATQLGVQSIPQGLLDYLKSWWELHIQTTDKAYTHFFNDMGVR